MIRGSGLATIAACVVLGSAVPAAAQQTCDGRSATIVGTPGDDTLVGTNGPDVIVGLGGNDTIRGRRGDDVICGGNGSDTIYGNNGEDRIFGQRGRDFIYGNAHDDHIVGGPGPDRIDAGWGDDYVRGGPGDDWIWGDLDDDTMDGGLGHDTLWGRVGDDDLAVVLRVLVGGETLHQRFGLGPVRADHRVAVYALSATDVYDAASGYTHALDSLGATAANQRAVKCYQRCGWQVVDVFQRGVLDFFEMEIRCTR